MTSTSSLRASLRLLSSTISKGSRQKRSIQSDSRFFQTSEEVRHAVSQKSPVVALETTIYTHGWPYPDNLKLAKRLDALVRHNGGVPAHCCVLDGVARVGLNDAELQQLVENQTARKASRRDLGYISGLSMNGPKISAGTTISGTMILAHLAGIKVFATGGLGGVHRGFEKTMDVSADLSELGRTPVAVISAGCKGFLDIPRTLEYLETAGVPVGTFADGRAGSVKFPAFWSRESPVKSPLTIRDELDAAAMIHAQFSLPLTSGLFFANPLPENHSIAPAEMDRIIDEALKRADAAGIGGAANTPFVLNAIKELSGGASVGANRALIEANVIRGTRVALALSKLELGQEPDGEMDGRLPASAYISWNDGATPPPILDKPAAIGSPKHARKVDVVVAGSVALDLACDFKQIQASSGARRPQMETSNPATMTHSTGGVGHNVALATHLAGGSVSLCSRIGDDLNGKQIEAALKLEGLPSELSISSKSKSAQYVAINDLDKSLVLAMADMSILEERSVEAEQEMMAKITGLSPKWLVLDANWHPGFIAQLLQYAKKVGIRTAFEPVSTAKAARLFSSLKREVATFPHPVLNLTTPNRLELTAMYDAAKDAELFEQQSWWKVIDNLGISSAGARVELAMATSSALVDEGIPQRCIQLLPFVPCILVKLGQDGVLLAQLLGADDARLSSPEAAPHIVSRSSVQGEGVGGVYMRLFPPSKELSAGQIVSVNGAGDTFLGVIMAAMTKRDGVYVEDCVDIAQMAATMTIQSSSSVSPDLTKLRFSLELL